MGKKFVWKNKIQKWDLEEFDLGATSGELKEMLKVWKWNFNIITHL